MKWSRVTLEATQYGLYPNKLLGRLVSRDDKPKILANSLPKSGTNLLLRSLYLMPDIYRRFQKTLLSDEEPLIIDTLQKVKKGEICAAHLKYSPERARLITENNIKHLLMVRDPRDVAVSNYIYITRQDTGHRLHDYFKNVLKTDDERLAASIQGITSEQLGGLSPSLSLAEHYRDYLAWADCGDSVKLVKFEDLVGLSGSGSEDHQRQEIASMAAYLGMELESDDISYIVSNLFSTASRTFNKGQIGAWKEHFGNFSEKAFADEFSGILGALDYSD
ncbi:MAG: sulfotransferase domain-containing protein [Gammaproteobacteria bacterium]|nr:sulfotransferase domain-containing protein [Gammaproteobacteria bacterium]